MSEWVQNLLDSPGCSQPRPTTADEQDAAAFEAQGFFCIPGVLLDKLSGGESMGESDGGSGGDGPISLAEARAAFIACGANTTEVGGEGELAYIREPALRRAIVHPRILPAGRNIVHAATWTVLQHDGPDHLGFLLTRCDRPPAHPPAGRSGGKAAGVVGLGVLALHPAAVAAA